MEDAWSQTKKELQKTTQDSNVRSCLRSLRPVQGRKGDSQHHLILELDNEELLDTALKHLKGPIQSRLASISRNPVSVEFRLRNDAQHQSRSWVRENLHLDAFCEGKANRVALMAARNILDHPGKVNPLYIYGDTGTGKSHLLNAIAVEHRSRNPASKCVLIRIDDFRMHFAEQLQKRGNLTLKNHYRKGDLLFIEDLHSLAGASANTLDELYFIFNTYYESGRQIVVSSETPVKDLSITSRWMSRFLSGMQVKLELPDPEMRKRILQNKLKESGLEIESSIGRILERIHGNARDIESAVNRLFFLKSSGIDLTEELVEQQLREFLSPGHTGPLSPEHITAVISEICKVETSEILGNSRKMEIALPRHLAMYLAVHYTDLNKSAVARFFRRTDHSTVIHAEKKIQMKLDREPAFQHLYRQVSDRLGITGG